VAAAVWMQYVDLSGQDGMPWIGPQPDVREVGPAPTRLQHALCDLATASGWLVAMK
jgi:hypothetical protein